MSGVAHMWHMQKDKSLTVADIGSIYLAQAGDMGTELGIPAFRYENDASLLPEWAIQDEEAAGVDAAGSEASLESCKDVRMGIEDLDCDGPMLDDTSLSNGDLGPELGADDEEATELVDNFELEIMAVSDADIDSNGLRAFFPNRWSIAAMQHIVNNLTRDAHKQMPWWNELFALLENIEGFLNDDDRRARFRCTCLQGGRFEVYDRLFLKFRQGLYEPRWREVNEFLKKLKKLLFALVVSWDEQGFLAGVDVSGKSRETQAEVQKAKETGKGWVEFSPAKLSNTLKSSKFLYYCNMTLVLEEIPSNLASGSELCPCHGAMLRRMTQYQRSKLQTLHYGCDGTCPMAGLNLPELIGGQLEAAVEDVWHLKENELRELAYPGVAAPSAEEWEVITGAFRQGKVSILLQLRFKTYFMKRLLVVLAGTAHVNEGLAHLGLKQFISSSWIPGKRRIAQQLGSC